MKIKDYAVEKGLTTGAIYKAVSRSGHSMKELTDRKGSITAAGYTILWEIYGKEHTEPSQEPQREPLNETPVEDSTIAELRDRLSEAERAKERAENALDFEKEQRIRAEEQAEKWERLYLELQDRSAQEREAHREELRAAHVLAAQAQETISKLSMNPIKRLFSGRKKEPVNTDGEVK